MSLGWSDERDKGDYRWVPECQGVYQLLRAGTVVYVGETTNMVGRLMEHERTHTGWGTYRYASLPPGTTIDERHRIEAGLIARHWPAWNRDRSR